MKNITGCIRYELSLLVLGVLFWVTLPAAAQTQTPALTTPNGDFDATRIEVGVLDRFLDSHPDLAQQLRQNPSLVNNEEFVENHADLQQFLQQHPEIREEFNENANRFMQQAQRFDRREDQNIGDRDLNRGELVNMDRFLDSHPEIAEQLRKNPSLVNNQEFVENHPALQQFLAQHPGVREEFVENPNGFMQQEQNFERNGGDINRGELVNMDRFLDSHPEIAEQLRKNPSLMNNEEFVENHPALQQFLAQNPAARQDFQENPNAFMQREQNFESRGGDINRGELTNMDRFLDSHPEIAEQLRKNPSLMNNEEFVENHPALQQFLAQNPAARQDFQENPNAFMQREQVFDRNEDQNRGDRDMNRGEMVTMDRFLDSHPEIAEQLRKNPSLVNKKEFVEDHPALQQFLAQHSEVREEFRENPTAFMQQEQRFDAREGTMVRGDRDVTRGELSSFNEFLEGHSNIAGELSKNPSLVKNEEYLENHPALRDYLKAHPQVREELTENPQSFLKMAQQSSSTPMHQTKPKAELKTK